MDYENLSHKLFRTVYSQIIHASSKFRFKVIIYFTNMSLWTESNVNFLEWINQSVNLNLIRNLLRELKIIVMQRGLPTSKINPTSNKILKILVKTWKKLVRIYTKGFLVVLPIHLLVG